MAANNDDNTVRVGKRRATVYALKALEKLQKHPEVYLLARGTLNNGKALDAEQKLKNDLLPGCITKHETGTEEGQYGGDIIRLTTLKISVRRR